MFTGIVERSVRVGSVSDGTGFRRLNLAIDWAGVKLGESVAVNGVCLTVAEIPEPGAVLAFDVVPETLARTNLGLVQGGDLVHVERSMQVGARVDGHFVQGHVDGRALLLDHLTAGDEWRMRIEAPEHLARYVVPKGSVCLDGVSLTVAAVDGNVFEVALIPTTLRLTQFQRRPKGWPLNFEADVVTKTIVSWLERRAECGDTDLPATTRGGTEVASPPPKQPSIREQLAAAFAAMTRDHNTESGAHDDPSQRRGD